MKEVQKLSGDQYLTLLQNFGYPVAGCFLVDFSRAAALQCSAAGGGASLPPKGTNPTSDDLWFCRLPTTCSDAHAAALRESMAKIDVATYSCFTATSSSRRRRVFWFALPLAAAALPILLC